jgi:hypothetical protein
MDTRATQRVDGGRSSPQRIIDAYERDNAAREGIVPAMGITRLDVPLSDIFWFSLKVWLANALIALPFVVVWLILS